MDAHAAKVGMRAAAMRDEVKTESRKQKAVGRESLYCLLPSAFCLLSFHPSALIPHPFVRVFCAVELPNEVRARAAEHIARLREEAIDVRASWERAEKMHITLKFLGEIARARVSDLQSAAERAALSAQPFELSIEGTGTFPPRGLALVLWLVVA